MRTSNPVLNDNAFYDVRSGSYQQAMTIQGTVNKSFILLFLVLAPAAWVWNTILQPSAGGISSGLLMGLVMGGAIGGLIFALVTTFKKEWSPVTAPLYALCEGLVLGGISAIFEAKYPGIVMQAVAITIATLLCLLSAYKSGMIRASENFKLGIVAATGGVFLVYLVSMILGIFHIQVPFIYGNGIFGIGFSLVISVIAALNLVLDFDFIEKGAEAGAPKYMEWYGAFGLMVTLIWLYMEILRLLAKLRSRD